MPRARRFGRFAAIAAVLALLAGGATACAGGTEPADAPGSSGGPESPGGPESSSVDGLAASVKQGRLDIAARRLVVHLDNDSGQPVTISRVEFVSPTLDEPLVRTKPVELAAGAGIDLRFDLTAARCEPGTTGEDATATAENGPRVSLDVETADEARSIELVPADPFDTLPRIHDDECFAERVAEVAELRLVEPLRVEGAGADQRAVIEIDVRPREGAGAGSGDDALVVERVLGTTLLAAEASGGDWPVDRRFGPGDAPFRLELPVRPARCDAHAIADDKRGTIMRLEIRDGEASGFVELVAGPELKAALYAYYGERCGLA